jgi:predicted dithiol-disulfide oxidoreductase (DUF899 family)
MMIMTQHQTVSREQWLDARRALLTEEKQLTQLREQLSERRRNLPWVRVEQEYTFEAPSGQRTLAELFDGRTQLVVYHFMFAPDATVPCKSCAFWADSFDDTVVHLAQRDVTLVAISRAPLPKLQSFAARLGWSFPWYSAGDGPFNYDYGVSFEAKPGPKPYNYTGQVNDARDMPGVSVFVREPDGSVFHTYSCYSRGIDPLNTTYQYLDLVPKGRNEADLPHPMSWVRFHDAY